jgi:anti-anti-sigma factor
MHEDLTITQNPGRGRTSLFKVSGRLDGKTAGKLIASCEDERKKGTNLVLNLSEVSFIASSGIGALLSVAERYRGQGVRLGFASVSPAVSSVVGLLNLEQFLSIFDTDDEALSSMENG